MRRAIAVGLAVFVLVWWLVGGSILQQASGDELTSMPDGMVFYRVQQLKSDAVRFRNVYVVLPFLSEQSGSSTVGEKAQPVISHVLDIVLSACCPAGLASKRFSHGCNRGRRFFPAASWHPPSSVAHRGDRTAIEGRGRR